MFHSCKVTLLYCTASQLGLKPTVIYHYDKVGWFVSLLSAKLYSMYLEIKDPN